jgi:hypothetical protein
MGFSAHGKINNDSVLNCSLVSVSARKRILSQTSCKSLEEQKKRRSLSCVGGVTVSSAPSILSLVSHASCGGALTVMEVERVWVVKELMNDPL